MLHSDDLFSSFLKTYETRREAEMREAIDRNTICLVGSAWKGAATIP